MLKPAVFLDRDSTLNQRVYDEVRCAMVSPLQIEQVSLRRDAARFIRGLNRMGYLCLVLTAQPELATRRLSVVRLQGIHQKLRADLARNGARVDGIFHSAEHPTLGRPRSAQDGGGGDGSDRDRGGGGSSRQAGQPTRSLLIQAASTHQVDLRRSFVVSELLVDMASGHAAGAETILLWDSEELPPELAETPEARPNHVARSLSAALRIIEAAREAALR